MVNGSQTISSGNGGIPLFVRASAAATLSAETNGIAEAVAAQPADQVVAAGGQFYRYNSFEFSYRQDFGKIVLLRQKPDTGEVVQQFPSEYYLRKYADSQRVARNAEDSGAAAAAKENAASAGADFVIAPPAASDSAVAAPAIDAAPAITSAPALPGSGASLVDITI